MKREAPAALQTSRPRFKRPVSVELLHLYMSVALKLTKRKEGRKRNKTGTGSDKEKMKDINRQTNRPNNEKTDEAND